MIRTILSAQLWRNRGSRSSSPRGEAPFAAPVPFTLFPGVWRSGPTQDRPQSSPSTTRWVKSPVPNLTSRFHALFAFFIALP